MTHYLAMIAVFTALVSGGSYELGSQVGWGRCMAALVAAPAPPVIINHPIFPVPNGCTPQGEGYVCD